MKKADAKTSSPRANGHGGETASIQPYLAALNTSVITAIAPAAAIISSTLSSGDAAVTPGAYLALVNNKAVAACGGIMTSTCSGYRLTMASISGSVAMTWRQAAKQHAIISRGGNSGVWQHRKIIANGKRHL